MDRAVSFFRRIGASVVCDIFDRCGCMAIILELGMSRTGDSRAGPRSNSSGDPSTRLAVYGSLAPGRSNHHRLSQIRGAWTTGTVRGCLIRHGWGQSLGFPALLPGAEGDAVVVHVLTSADLPNHWERLDAFEGSGYRRVVIVVRLEDGTSVDANIYAANTA